MSTLFQGIGNIGFLRNTERPLTNPDHPKNPIPGPLKTFLSNEPVSASVFAVGKVRDEFLNSLEVPTFTSNAKPLPPLRAGKVRSKSLLGGG